MWWSSMIPKSFSCGFVTWTPLDAHKPVTTGAHNEGPLLAVKGVAMGNHCKGPATIHHHPVHCAHGAPPCHFWAVSQWILQTLGDHNHDLLLFRELQEAPLGPCWFMIIMIWGALLMRKIIPFWFQFADNNTFVCPVSFLSFGSARFPWVRCVILGALRLNSSPHCGFHFGSNFCVLW